MSSPDPLTGIGKTALSVARVRARETLRPDHLFDDPYAPAFLAAFPAELVTSTAPASLRAMLGFHIVVRTRFFDDYLLAARAAGGVGGDQPTAGQQRG